MTNDYEKERKMIDSFEEQKFFKYVLSRKNDIAEIINKIDGAEPEFFDVGYEGNFDDYYWVVVRFVIFNIKRDICIMHECPHPEFDRDEIPSGAISIKSKFETGSLVFQYGVTGKTNDEIFDDVLKAIVVLSRGDL